MQSPPSVGLYKADASDYLQTMSTQRMIVF